ncbi:sigma-70 family RNA polymerase sigma factor [bacterium]|nr:sigma-70 family RNA polymerase sigma factor [bacterium]
MPVNEIELNLLKRCFDHQEGAWPDFVDSFLGLIYHVIGLTSQNRSVVLSDSDHETLAGEILEELVRNDYALLRQFRGESSLAAYLTVVTRRICVRRLVMMRQEAALGHVHAHRQTFDGSSSEIEPVLALAEVDRLLGILEPDDARIVRLYHVEFLGFRDIARKLDIEEQEVTEVLRTARKRLSEEPATE